MRNPVFGISALVIGFGILLACGGGGASSGANSSKPEISNFVVSPDTITAAQDVTLSWSVVGATSLTISPGNVTMPGTRTGETVHATGTTTYTLTATNTAGSVMKPATVTMTSSNGEVRNGRYNLGPVNWQEQSYHNACSPYPPEIQNLEGDFLVGLSNVYAGDGSLCDTCVLIRTAKKKSLVGRVVTYGNERSPGDIDLSQSAYDALNVGEFPRDMTWQLVRCPDTGNIVYQFKTGANVYWSSFWVRNASKPIAKVEVKSVRHPDWFALRRETDGTFYDDQGFGLGAFTLRVTAVDGDAITDTYNGFTAGEQLPSASQFH